MCAKYIHVFVVTIVYYGCLHIVDDDEDYDAVDKIMMMMMWLWRMIPSNDQWFW